MAIQKLTRISIFEGKLAFDVKEDPKEVQRLISKGQNDGVNLTTHTGAGLYLSNRACQNLDSTVEIEFDAEAQQRQAREMALAQAGAAGSGIVVPMPGRPV